MDVTARPGLGLLDAIAFRVPDVAAAVAFYRGVLGAVVIEDGGAERSRLRLANVDIVLERGVAAGGAEPVFRSQDIRALRTYLLGQGAAVVRDLAEVPGGLTLAFADPAGNVLGAIQYGTSLAEGGA